MAGMNDNKNVRRLVIRVPSFANQKFLECNCCAWKYNVKFAVDNNPSDEEAQTHFDAHNCENYPLTS